MFPFFVNCLKIKSYTIVQNGKGVSQISCDSLDMKKHKMHYFIIYLLLPSADSSNSDCTLCTTMSWGTWGDCNRDCGGGFRKRYREVCCPKTVEYNTCVSQTCPLIPREEKEQEQSCNNQCYNGGQFNNDTCHCQPGWIEPCCQSRKLSQSSNTHLCILHQYSCFIMVINSFNSPKASKAGGHSV